MFGRLSLSVSEKFAAVLSSGVLTASALLICMKLNIAPSYPDFIVGNITWSAGTKLQDLIAAPICIAVAFLAFTSLGSLIRNQKRVFGESSTTELLNQLIWWSLPAVATIFALLLDSTIDASLIYISAAGILFVPIAVALNAAKQIKVSAQMLGLSVLAILLVALTPLELALVLGRAPLSLVGEANLARHAMATNVVALLGLVFGLIYAVRSPQQLARLLPSLLLVGQVGLSLVYLTLYPARLLQPDGVLSRYETTIWLKILVLGMISWAMFDVVRRFRSGSSSTDPVEALSPIAIFALLVGLRVGNTVAPHISPDDYHFGESLIGWWSYLHGVIPYVGYFPAHGLVDDDLTRFLSSVFYDGSAGSVSEAGRISFAILAFAAFWSICHFFGSIGLASVAIFFLGGRLAWFFLTPFLCLWLSRTLRKRPSRWLSVWILTSPIVIFGAPAQGLLLVGSSGVVAAHSCWRLWRNREEREWASIAIALATAIILGLASPLGPMLLGAIRYVLENGPINQVAYGIPWVLSWQGGAKTGLVFEAIRMSWVLIPLGCLAIVYVSVKDNSRREGDFLPAVAIILFALLLMPYSMGRIDPGGVSRAGVGAIFGWTVLLPIAIWPLADPCRRVPLVLLITAMGAALHFTSLSFSSFVSAAVSKISTPPLRDGGSVGLANIGKASVQGEHWDRLARLSRLLGTRLAPGDTYLDLTSRNAQYFYLNRRPIVSVTAPYNMVPLAQQRRAVEDLSVSLPDLALLEGDNIIHDGGGLALRNPYLYRFIVDNYVPRFEDGFIVGYKRTHAPSDEGSMVDVPVRSITDENWDHGFHRREAAIVVDDPALVSVMRVGDQVRMDNGETRRIDRVWVSGNAVWLDGGVIEAVADGRSTKVQLAITPQVIADYRASLLQRAFSQSDFQKIPVAWGRSERSLEKRMTWVKGFDGLDPTLNQLGLEDGRYKIEGNDPSLSFDISSLRLSGKDAGLLRFGFSCVGRVAEPRIQVFWWGDDHQGPLEEISVRFTADNGTLIVPLDASPRWLTLKHVKGLRIDLDNASACRAFDVKNLGLFQRRFE